MSFSLGDSPQWRWDWTALCGEEGLKIWSAQRHDIGVCFQLLFLQIPVLALLACASAYYFGRQHRFVCRGKVEIYSINLRSIIVLMLTLLPFLHVYIAINKCSGEISTIYYMLYAVESITWLSHLGYTWALRKRLGLSPRGPVFTCVLWTLYFVLVCISLRSNVLIYNRAIRPSYCMYLSYGFSLCKMILQIFYGLTLIPSDGTSMYLNFGNRYTEIGETQPLLQENNYIRFSEEGDPSYLGVATEDDNWLSRLLFYWVNPLMEKGVQGKLNSTEDLYDLPVSLNCGSISHKLDKALTGATDDPHRHPYRQQSDQGSLSFSSCETLTSPDLTFVKVQKHRVTLFRALHKCFWLQFYSIGLLKLIADCAGFAGPLLLNRLVGFIENKSEDVKWGYVYAAGLMSTTLLAAFCDTHFNFLMSLVGLKMRGALVTTIYRKTLTVSSSRLNSAFSMGEIVNFMSTDTDRIVNACPSFHALWSIPFQLGVTLYLLYTQVGLAFLAGVALSVVLIPVNKLIADKIGDLSAKLMERKDARVKLITEILRGIKAIKLYVWEQHFIRLVTRLREEELKFLKGRKYLDALCVYFWATTPVLISILTFTTYSLMGNKLTAATVFTGIALLNMLIGPLNAFPWVLNGMTEAWVSIKRIQKLLDLSDLDLDIYYDDDLIDDNLNCDIVVRRGGFSWGKVLSREEKQKLHAVDKLVKKDKGKGKGKSSMIRRKDVESHVSDERYFNLKEITLKIKKGEFIGIIGSVGSGKSSLLAAILAELNMHEGYIGISQVESGFGFVSQQPWLQRGTLRDNILFGRAYEDARYKQTVLACGLAEDLARLPAGDLTGVGEGGATLSGGQRARVALARAVYQDKAVYLLDDVLAAVDPPVAAHIFRACVQGLLRDKTRLLCTHHVNFLMHADRVLLLEEGTVKQCGRPEFVLSKIDDTLPIDIELEESMRSDSTASTSLVGSIRKEDKPKDDSDSVLQAEASETGSVRFGVYGSYWKAIGHLLSLSILIAISLMQISRNMTDWWLSRWVSESFNNETNSSFVESRGVVIEQTPMLSTSAPFEAVPDSTKYYLQIYIGLAVLNSVFTLFRAFLFAYGGITAAARIHKLLLKSVIKAKSTFFDISPLGRILNRFSSDTYTIDDSLPFILNILLAQFFGLLGTVIVTIYGLPWICMILVPLIPVYNWIQNHYRLTSRQLKRIESVSLSPVYSHFNESLQGLTTIRAMRATQRFKRDNEDNVEANMKAQFASQAAARWLGLRLQFIGVAMVAGVSFIAVIQHQYDGADAGLIGLAMSYALSVTGALSGVVSAFTETEREMIAVERVDQYIEQVPPESNYCVVDPPFAWPTHGVIAFNDVVLKYREHLAPSLRGISFETRPSEKVGVIGRTGAGKSSLVNALFRLVEIESGSITIDSVDITTLSLSALRSRLFCIPQEPFLFSGTLRENLDPLDEFRETEIWSALEKVNLGDVIKRLGGLDNKVEASGMNFSAGQKQLICLARAVLHNAKVLCIDEATANVDQNTDHQIQVALRTAFRACTVITIAHRVQTILDSDRVLVLSDGQVVDFDHPDNLLSDSDSIFYQFVNQE